MTLSSDLRRRDLTPEMKDGHGIERFNFSADVVDGWPISIREVEPDGVYCLYRPEYEDVERLRQENTTMRREIDEALMLHEGSATLKEHMAGVTELQQRFVALEQENARLRDVSDSYRVGLAEAEAKLAALRDKVDETLAALEGTTMEIDAAKKLQKLSQHLAEAR
jgi:SMC interacting uncharacterized protein involved in chromosome segregation